MPSARSDVPPSTREASASGLPRCERRAWDSDFFGVSIAQIDRTRLDAAGLSAAVRCARDASIACLYFLADADHDESIRAAEANRFALIDVRITLERLVPADIGVNVDRARIREALPGDVPALQSIARVSHRNTRFHRDPRFAPERSDELYAVWIARSVAGELADAVWVADVDGAPRGYLTASRRPDGAAIGLVAVDADMRGRGCGEHLVRAALGWTAGAGLGRISVVTQGHNADAVRFYERAGFATSRVQLWYHRWLSDD